MLTREDNDIITRVGPGTVMGNLLRRYWTPVCLSSEIPEPDCTPVRVRILPSEDRRLGERRNVRAGLTCGLQRVLDAPEVALPIAVNAENLAEGYSYRSRRDHAQRRYRQQRQDAPTR